jgi:hypothetical protein
MLARATGIVVAVKGPTLFTTTAGLSAAICVVNSSGPDVTRA